MVIRIDMGFVKINKKEARRRFSQGEKIFVQSCKLPLGCVWQTAMEAQRDFSLFNGYDFDDLVNSFETFNCDCTRGRYASFYINV